jgi:MFS family permease
MIDAGNPATEQQATATAGSRAPTSSSGRLWVSLVIIASAQLMVVLDATIVNIAPPSGQADLGFSDSDRQWVITGYTLSLAGLRLLGGRAADLIGRKRAFLIGLAGFAASSAMAGAAPSLAVLVAGRAVQGAFGALLLPTATAVAPTWP